MTDSMGEEPPWEPQHGHVLGGLCLFLVPGPSNPCGALEDSISSMPQKRGSGHDNRYHLWWIWQVWHPGAGDPVLECVLQVEPSSLVDDLVRLLHLIVPANVVRGLLAVAVTAVGEGGHAVNDGACFRRDASAGFNLGSVRGELS